MLVIDIIAGRHFFSGHSCLWTSGLLLCVVTAAGCPRMVSLDYQANNPLRGQGTVGTAPFRYQVSDEHRVLPRQVETDPLVKIDLFLSQAIGAFFSDALRLELSRSGKKKKKKKGGGGGGGGKKKKRVDVHGSVERAHPILLALFLDSERGEYASPRRDLDSQGNGRLHAPIYRSRAGCQNPLIGGAQALHGGSRNVFVAITLERI